MSFTDKVVLVTGASSGIGAAIALQFAGEGAKLAIVGRNETKLNDVSKKCEQKGCKPLTIVADMTKDEDVKRIMSNTISHFKKLDVLVNNAGMASTASILDENLMQVFEQTLATNLRSVVYLTNLAAPHLIETKGNVVNVSSVAGSSIISPRSSSYCASKAGLDHFGRCAALELAPKGVRVNNVCPGPVQTDIVENMGVDDAVQKKIWGAFAAATATGEISVPDEVADLVLFLASSKARSVTGSSCVIDNGSMLKGTWISN